MIDIYSINLSLRDIKVITTSINTKLITSKLFHKKYALTYRIVMSKSLIFVKVNMPCNLNGWTIHPKTHHNDEHPYINTSSV